MVARSLATLTAPALRKRHCRVIVRNLSFEATEQNVADKLSKFGPLTEVSLPRVQAEGGRGGVKMKSRGFAFVAFLCSIDAAGAVGAAGAGRAFKVCNREVAVDFCQRKDRYTEGGEGEGEGGKEGKEEGGGKEGGEEEENENEEDDEDEDDEDDGDDEDEEEDLVDGGDEEEDKDDDGGEGTKPPEDVHEGCTVFFRGLSLEADQRDLRRACAPFGATTLCIITKVRG